MEHREVQNSCSIRSFAIRTEERGKVNVRSFRRIHPLKAACQTDSLLLFPLRRDFSGRDCVLAAIILADPMLHER